YELNFSNEFFIPFSIKNFDPTLILSLKKNIGWITGITFEKLGNNFLITHVVQNIFVGKMNYSDIKFFNKYSYNVFDHRWPSKLFFEKRLKMVSSSDLFYCIELTAPGYSKIKDLTDHWNLSNLPLRYNNKRYFHSNLMGMTPYFLRVEYEKL
ncbi:hypothetical protein N9E50_03040, partial [Alphaproteobacteria bacterium]|nr:hypothetical protein [Alphaproteobacteria bacterium]